MALTILHLINKSTPPAADSGGANRSVDWLAKAQADAGYQVYVGSPEGHSTDYFRHLQLASDIAPEVLAQQLPQDVDIVHLHGGFPRVERNSLVLQRPFIQTVRTNLARYAEDDPQRIAKRNAVFVSAAHMHRHDGTRFIYNGIPVDDYQYSETKQGKLLFLSKVRRSKKGVDTAIRLARKLRYPLIIAGGYRLANPSTWLPISRYIHAAGTVEGSQKLKLLAEADALLVPIQWEEPFGLTVPEALASGTPVIAMRRGAMPELIEDGKTGFLCDSFADMQVAIGRISSLSPADCRQAAEQRFSIKRVCADYATAYHDVLQGAEW